MNRAESILTAFVALPVLLTAARGQLAAQRPGQAVDQSEFVINPVVPHRADPFVYHHTDGFY